MVTPSRSIPCRTMGIIMPAISKKKKIPFLKYLQVFHIDDVEGVKPLDLNDVVEASNQQFDSDEEAEKSTERKAPEPDTKFNTTAATRPIPKNSPAQSIGFFSFFL